MMLFYKLLATLLLGSLVHAAPPVPDSIWPGQDRSNLHPSLHNHTSLSKPELATIARAQRLGTRDLLRRIQRAAPDPETSNLPVSDGRAERWQWNEPAGEIDKAKPFVSLIVQVPERDKLALKRSDLVYALWGVGQVWIQWQQLDFQCKILGRGKGLGDVQLIYTDRPDRPETA
ncbi:MAG: hypothetical protein Q9182_002763 [Xanthomendoza sp. 2 TL-2023]